MVKPISPAVVETRWDWPEPSRSDQEDRRTGVDRRIQLDERAWQAIEDYKTKGVPFALYFRKYDITIAHGPKELGTRLIENVLYDSMPPGANLITVQDHKDFAAYGGRRNVLERSAPALFLDDEHWEETVKAIIPAAELILSEICFLSSGVHFELETAYQAQKWDKTVLLLPPYDSYLKLLDNDPLIQKFPRAIWMDAFHTEKLVEMAQFSDLISRIGQIAGLPEEERLRRIEKEDSTAIPVDLLPLAKHYEFNAGMWSMEDSERSLYYGFWELFRSASIRAVLFLKGDTSLDNRSRWARSCLEMAAIMLRPKEEGDKIIVQGDLDFAKQMAETSHALLEKEQGFFMDHLRQRAEELYASVDRVQRLLREQPARFELRPRFGPFPVRKRGQQDTVTTS
jgi:hypothetical protein